MQKYQIVDASISAIIVDIEEALRGSNREMIEALREKLNNSSEGLAQEIMDKEIRGALTGKKLNDM